MAKQVPTTIAQYIEAAPTVSHSHLNQVYAILKSVAPEAEEVIKWGAPFFVEPRFLFSFAAFKAHCCFAPMPESLEAFAEELKQHKTTKNYLQIPYAKPVPEDLIRRIAEHRVQAVRARDDDSFW